MLPTFFGVGGDRAQITIPAGGGCSIARAGLLFADVCALTAPGRPGFAGLSRTPLLRDAPHSLSVGASTGLAGSRVEPAADPGDAGIGTAPWPARSSIAPAE